MEQYDFLDDAAQFEIARLSMKVTYLSVRYYLRHDVMCEMFVHAPRT